MRRCHGEYHEKPVGRRFRTSPLGIAVFGGVAMSLLFVTLPVADTVQLAFQSWEGTGSRRFVGLENVERLVGDGQFALAVLRSMVFAVATSVASVTIGTFVAIALQRGGRLRNTARFLIFLPVAMPAAVLAAAWRGGLDPYLGWMTRFLDGFHLSGSGAWLGSGPSAFFWAVVIATLHSTGIPMVFVSAALRDIPEDVYEAAAVDGASGWKLVRYVTLPMVAPAMFAVALLELIWGFFAFDYIYVLTRGGPGTTTEVVSTFVYQRAFVNREYGYAAMASIGAAVCFGLLVGGTHVLRRRAFTR